MVALASSFELQASQLPKTAPVPVASSFDLVTGDYLIVFDQDLVSGVQSSSGLSMVISNSARVVNPSLTVDGNVVTGTTTVAGPAPVSDRIAYVSAVGNLVGVNDLPVEGFLIVPSVGVPVPLSATYSVSGGDIEIYFSEDVFINTATKADFVAVAVPNTLNVQSIAEGGGNLIDLEITVDGPGSPPSRIEYSGKVDGIEDIDGNDVPFFIIGLDVVP